MPKPFFRTSLAAALAAALSLSLAGPALAQPAAQALERAASAVARGDYALAEKELATIKGGKERSKALAEKARIEILTGRYTDAIATAKTLAGLGKEARFEAIALKGKALASQGKLADAITALK